MLTYADVCVVWQKLWMFNMGYEHHEQPPIYFGSARKEDNIVV
jgi:hypothetical protein